MKLAETLQSALILEELGAGNRDRAIDAILGRMAAEDLFSLALVPELREAIIRRDELGPTGIGEGVAIPHAWHRGLERTVAALAVSRQGLDYSSLDGEPVHLILLVLTPVSTAADLQKRAVFDAWLPQLRDPAFRASLRLAGTPQDLWAVIRAEGLTLGQGIDHAEQ